MFQANPPSPGLSCPTCAVTGASDLGACPAFLPLAQRESPQLTRVTRGGRETDQKVAVRHADRPSGTPKGSRTHECPFPSGPSSQEGWGRGRGSAAGKREQEGVRREEHRTGNGAQFQALLRTCCVTSGKDPPLSEPQSLLCRRKGWTR